MRIADLPVRQLYRRTNDRNSRNNLWIKVDDRQHANAEYDSMAGEWQMGPGLEDFNPNEEVEVH
jgi:hypothetical protein